MTFNTFLLIGAIALGLLLGWAASGSLGNLPPPPARWTVTQRHADGTFKTYEASDFQADRGTFIVTLPDGKTFYLMGDVTATQR